MNESYPKAPIEDIEETVGMLLENENARIAIAGDPQWAFEESALIRLQESLLAHLNAIKPLKSVPASLLGKLSELPEKSDLVGKRLEEFFQSSLSKKSLSLKGRVHTLSSKL